MSCLLVCWCFFHVWWLHYNLIIFEELWGNVNWIKIKTKLQRRENRKVMMKLESLNFRLKKIRKLIFLKAQKYQSKLGLWSDMSVFRFFTFFNGFYFENYNKTSTISSYFSFYWFFKVKTVKLNFQENSTNVTTLPNHPKSFSTDKRVSMFYNLS